MVYIDNIDKIVDVNTLSVEGITDLESYFNNEKNKDRIVEIAPDRYCTFQMMSKGKEPVDLRVRFCPDMFYLAITNIVEYGYAIADDENGNHMAVLNYKPSTYLHKYEYSGGADLWFLDQYDCIFLHGCNEFSVELCQSALQLWKGKRLVLVGEDWEKLIPMMPDIPTVECYYEPRLLEKRVAELTEGLRFLRVVYGIPHAENIERYEQGIMYYDEVMSFVFMFSDYRELGELNQDKNFFVMDGYYNTLGLFAIFDKVVSCSRYAKSKGMIPLVQLKLCDGSFYQNEEEEDIWSKFYNQPEAYSLEEVMHSKHVFFSPGFYNGSVQSTLMDEQSNGTVLAWPNGIYNERVKSYVAEKQKKFLPYPEKTLGVLARGTDYVNAHLHNHPIYASKEMICEKIDEVRETWGVFEYIYIATEDAEYCQYFKDRYGDRVTFTDQERYTTAADETLSQMHAKETVKRDGFLLGVEYIASIELLSQCHSLIASGGCGGVNEAIRVNDGAYKNFFIFDLGVNE